MPASTLSGRSVALLRVNLDDYTSEGRSISHGNYTRTPKMNQIFITPGVVLGRIRLYGRLTLTVGFFSRFSTILSNFARLFLLTPRFAI
jgi:hypothetical protein